jgi:hypothetical protein
MAAASTTPARISTALRAAVRMAECRARRGAFSLSALGPWAGGGGQGTRIPECSSLGRATTKSSRARRSLTARSASVGAEEIHASIGSLAARCPAAEHLAQRFPADAGLKRPHCAHRSDLVSPGAGGGPLRVMACVIGLLHAFGLHPRCRRGHRACRARTLDALRRLPRSEVPPGRQAARDPAR